MTRIGWISLVLFVLQAGFFGISISDFNRFAEVGAYAYNNCNARWGPQSESTDHTQRLACIEAAGRNVEENRRMAIYMWAGLAIGSVVTLFGMWKGRRDRSSRSI